MTFTQWFKAQSKQNQQQFKDEQSKWESILQQSSNTNKEQFGYSGELILKQTHQSQLPSWARESAAAEELEMTMQQKREEFCNSTLHTCKDRLIRQSKFPKQKARYALYVHIFRDYFIHNKTTNQIIDKHPNTLNVENVKQSIKHLKSLFQTWLKKETYAVKTKQGNETIWVIKKMPITKKELKG